MSYTSGPAISKVTARWSHNQEDKRTKGDAQLRNHFRFKTLGYHNFGYTKNPNGVELITQDEKAIIDAINSLVGKLKKNWSINTVKLGFNVKSYTCSACNKHSDKEHLLLTSGQIRNFCYKCYKRYNE